MHLLESLDWREFIDSYPGMRLWPQTGVGLGINGTFAFEAQIKEMPAVSDEYKLAMIVPPSFPKDIPAVKELGGKIPSDGKHHQNGDGTLCLGAPLRLLVTLAAKPTLVGFAENCLVPYLYAMSLNLNYGVPFVFGELQHGTPGEMTDYADLLNLDSPDKARQALKLLGMKERCANKHPCPCGCGKRLGRCDFRIRISSIRSLSSLSWFRNI